MSGIEQIVQRQKARSASSGGGIENLWLQQDDVVRFHFLWNGVEDPSPYFLDYAAHQLPPDGGARFGRRVYCPQLSGHDYDYACAYCEDLTEFPRKERLLMWLFVHEWLQVPNERRRQNAGDTPTIEHNGRQYLNVKLEKPMLWEVSGWIDSKASPLQRIYRLFSMTNHDLTSSQMELVVNGAGLGRSYDIDPVGGSGPLDAATRAAAEEAAVDLRQKLAESLSAAEQVQRPAEQPQPTNGQPAPAQPAPAQPPAQPKPFNFLQKPGNHPNISAPFGGGKEDA